MDRDKAVARGVELGIEPEVAAAVVSAYEGVGRTLGRSYDPALWSKTVWLAEADRWRRSPDAATHHTLLLHLQRLGDTWEAKAKRGARGWDPGQTGERLTKL
ncbi:MAG: hypothetical protein HZB16_01235 [Armatimonadetes bacterium]|nr:hypothetical protein [Armatimonadota bacterium]